MNIRNITYRDFLELDEFEKIKYVQLFAVSGLAKQPVNHLGLLDPFGFDNKKHLTFWTVKNIQSKKIEPITMFDWLLYIDEWDVSKMDQVGKLQILEANQQASFMRETLVKVSEMELNSLSGYPTPEQVEAGIDMFDRFGSFNQLYELQRILRYDLDQCRNMAYMEAFTVLAYSATSSRFEKRLNEIYSRKK